MSKHVTRAIAQRLTNPDPGSSRPASTFRTATITAIASDGSLNVTLPDAAVLTGVRALASYAPAVGDVVRLEKHGPVVLVLGAIGPTFGRTLLEAVLPTTNSTTLQQFTLASGFARLQDPGGLYNPTTGLYTVPSTGNYQLTASLRLADGSPAIGYGIDVASALADSSTFEWDQFPATSVSSTRRYTTRTTRVTRFTAGTTIGFVYYLDSSTAVSFAGATMNIQRCS